MATDQIERVTNLLALLLDSPTPITAARIFDVLAEQYPPGESAKRGAFERDKRLLRSQGIPLEQTVLGGEQAGQTAYLIDRHRYELPDLDLTEDETVALQIAVAMVRSDVAGDAVWKLAAGGRGDPEPPPIAASVPDLPALAVLSSAAADRSEVRFDYRGVARRLDPYAVACRDGHWYVLGHDHVRGEVRTFRVDRIDGAVSVGQANAFERPAGFSPRDVYPDDPKMLEIGPAEATHATVLVGAGSAAFVRRELGSDAVAADRPDGSIEVVVPCRNVAAFRSWLFGIGDALVLGPEPIRRHVVEWLEALAGKEATA